jgi:hypothetical protein
MSTSNSESLGGLLLVALAILAIWLSDWVPFRKEVAVYEARCALELVNGSCPINGWVAGGKVNFRTSTETKTVVYWTDGAPPNKYDNCAIVDVKNWSCVEHHTNYDQMVDGVLAGLPADDATSRSVPKWEWWWLKFKQM